MCHLDFSIGLVYIRVVLLKPHVSKDYLVFLKLHYFCCDFFTVTLIVNNDIGQMCDVSGRILCAIYIKYEYRIL